MTILIFFTKARIQNGDRGYGRALAGRKALEYTGN